MLEINPIRSMLLWHVHTCFCLLSSVGCTSRSQLL